MRIAVITGGVLWGLLALIVYSDAGVDCLTGLFMPGCGLLIGLLWVAVSATTPDLERRPRVRWFWWSVPVIGCLGLFLATTNRDLAVRVWLCESELQQFAEECRQHPNAPSPIDSRGVGLFFVERVCVEDNEVLLFTARSGFIDSAGIVYRPDGNPPSYARPYQHLFGPWWWFFEDF